MSESNLAKSMVVDSDIELRDELEGIIRRKDFDGLYDFLAKERGAEAEARENINY